MALAISEAMQQAFNTISSYSDANYERMYSNLERQRDVSIMFAGESTTAREEIERQYEERRKRIQRQQAESQKQNAIFNAIINTAQAIVGALPNIPMSIAVGIIGAAQIALIASQPIPQFYKGTQNAPEGLAWTDEKGAELHTDKNGKIKFTVSSHIGNSSCEYSEEHLEELKKYNTKFTTTEVIRNRLDTYQAETRFERLGRARQRSEIRKRI
jgi:hypothetical protein